MKLQLSDGQETRECEVFDHEGITVVILDGQRFEFDLPDDEVFQLFNSAHDKLGRFASKGGVKNLSEAEWDDLELSALDYTDGNGRYLKRFVEKHGKKTAIHYLTKSRDREAKWEKDNGYTPDYSRLYERAIEAVKNDSYELSSEDKEILQLANPYHDQLGRFASKGGRVATAVGIGIASATGAGVTAAGKQAIRSGTQLLSDPAYTAGLGVIGASIALNKLKYSKEQNAQYEKFKTNATNLVPEGYKNPNLKVRQHDQISTYVLAATDPVFGNSGPLTALSAGFVTKVGSSVANISPQVKRWALDTSDSPEAAVRRTFAEGVIVHESLHTRPRTGSMNILNARFKMGIEEGLNDTLTERFTKKGSTSAYAHYRDGMTKIAMTLNDNDRKKALQWIDDSHKKSIGPMDIGKQLSAKTGQKVHWWDVYDYVNNHSGASSTPKLAGIIGNKTGYARQFNGDIIKKRPSLALDIKTHRVITGAIETAAGWYVGTKTAEAFRQIAFAGIMGALNDLDKQRKLLEDSPATEPDFLDFLSQVENLEQLIPVIQEAKHRAIQEGIDPLEIELAFQYALSTVTLGNASAFDDTEREESLDELTEMVQEIDTAGVNLSDDEVV